jgi:hypothetical protein
MEDLSADRLKWLRSLIPGLAPFPNAEGGTRTAEAAALLDLGPSSGGDDRLGAFEIAPRESVPGGEYAALFVVTPLEVAEPIEGVPDAVASGTYML